MSDCKEQCECGHSRYNHSYTNDVCLKDGCGCHKFKTIPKQEKTPKKKSINYYRLLWCVSIAALALPIMALGFCYTIVIESWGTGRTLPGFIRSLIELED